jgi:hypothetical protein
VQRGTRLSRVSHLLAGYIGDITQGLAGYRTWDEDSCSTSTCSAVTCHVAASGDLWVWSGVDAFLHRAHVTHGSSVCGPSQGSPRVLLLLLCRKHPVHRDTQGQAHSLIVGSKLSFKHLHSFIDEVVAAGASGAQALIMEHAGSSTLDGLQGRRGCMLGAHELTRM